MPLHTGKCEDKDTSLKTQKAFEQLCKKYDNIISKNSGDIGETMLIEMEIDTWNHPPIASKPYTLPLKHYKWVQRHHRKKHITMGFTSGDSPQEKHTR